LSNLSLEDAMKHVTINSSNVFDKQYLVENSHIVFKYRELIIEIERSDNPENSDTYRFKIGDGITPYKDLKYVSTIYSLFPSFKLFNKEYTKCVEIKFGEVD
jgi:hypothetical protein